MKLEMRKVKSRKRDYMKDVRNDKGSLRNVKRKVL